MFRGTGKHAGEILRLTQGLADEICPHMCVVFFPGVHSSLLRISAAGQKQNKTATEKKKLVQSKDFILQIRTRNHRKIVFNTVQLNPVFSCCERTHRDLSKRYAKFQVIGNKNSILKIRITLLKISFLRHILFGVTVLSKKLSGPTMNGSVFVEYSSHYSSVTNSLYINSILKIN